MRNGVPATHHFDRLVIYSACDTDWKLSVATTHTHTPLSFFQTFQQLSHNGTFLRHAWLPTVAYDMANAVRAERFRAKPPAIIQLQPRVGPKPGT
jgi:hypothetical protein